MQALLYRFQRKTLYSFFITVGSVLLVACNNGSSDANKTDQNTPITDATQSIKLVPGQSAAFLESYLKGSLRQNIANSIHRAPGTDAKDNAGGGVPETEDAGLATNDEFTETNTQVLGVDESDLVKYDGQHLYIAVNKQRYHTREAAGTISIEAAATKDSLVQEPTEEVSAEIRIMETSEGDMPSATEIARIKLDEKYGNISGLYLHNSQLAVLGNSDSFNWNTWYRYDYWSDSKTFISLMDVADPARASTIWSLEIEGSIIDSRRIDNTLYLVTRYVPNLAAIDWYVTNDEEIAKNNQAIEKLSLDDLLPKTIGQNGDTVNLVSADNCYVPESAAKGYAAPALVTLSAIDLNDPDSMTSVCVAGYSSGIFSSTEALYLFNDQWHDGTVVHKFAFTDQGTVYKGSGTIPGSLGWRAPSFRLTEKDGALVAVSTVFPDAGIDLVEPVRLDDTPVSKDDGLPSESSATGPAHTLTVLTEGSDNELVTIASLPNDNQPKVIGKPDEDIYAVRFTGDRGYIVTYQKTDPLYVVDLSDISNPVISGELHIEGYSDYLHPIAGQYLIGVGKASVIVDNMAWYQGVQIGLFDINDLTSPRLVRQIEIGRRGTETDVSRDHKAFSLLPVDTTGYRMAIPMRVHVGEQNHPSDWTDWVYDGLHLFDIELEGGLSIEEAGSIVGSRASSTDPYGSYTEVQRGIIHGDVVHYVYGESVLSANWNNPKETSTGTQ
ncbi:MAG: hypothetical protein CSA50_01435 [Gammaproteobacteria bacterium]|nr:MAG: hypothetical protein CSA50_01435 [Gammaproteobacteria bacterium]